MHVNYAETVLPMRDGLTKLRDFPKEFGGSGEPCRNKRRGRRLFSRSRSNGPLTKGRDTAGDIAGFSHRLVRPYLCGITGNPIAVPGPVAGAGLPALALAGGALWLFRKLRSRRQWITVARIGFFVFNRAFIRPLTYREPNRLLDAFGPWWRVGRWWVSVAIVPHTQAK